MTEVFLIGETAPLGQVKKAPLRLIAASPQPLTAAETALNETSQRKHSTKRQKTFAGTWINRDTDTYIEHRLKEGKKADPNLTRSAVIRMMLEERAQDETIIQQHATLAPLIRETMRNEFQEFFQQFLNRYLALNARIAYEVGKIFPFLVGAFESYLDMETLHKLENISDTAARTNITRRSPQVDEVIQTLKQSLEEKT